MKTCKTCGEEKWNKEFYATRHVCKKCVSVERKKHYARNKEYREQQKKWHKVWYQGNKEQQRLYKNHRYKTDAEYREKRSQLMKEYNKRKKLRRLTSDMITVQELEKIIQRIKEKTV